MTMTDWSTLSYNKEGLIPAVLLDGFGGKVLDLVHLDRETLEKIAADEVWIFSATGPDGKTEERRIPVLSILRNPEGTSLLVKLAVPEDFQQKGGGGGFSDTLWLAGGNRNLPVTRDPGMYGVLAELYRLILYKRSHGGRTSYVHNLLQGDPDELLEKIGAMTVDTVIASKNGDKDAVTESMSDLWYHCMMLLAYHNITPTELLRELTIRETETNPE